MTQRLKYQEDSFELVNPSTRILNFAFLASDWVFNPPLIRTPIGVIQGGPTDYIQLVNSLEFSPIKIIGIRLITTNSNQLTQPLIWSRRDANGEVETFSDFPSNLISPYQFQSSIVDIDYKGIKVGVNEYFTYAFLPQTTVRITFKYESYSISDLLKFGNENNNNNNDNWHSNFVRGDQYHRKKHC